MATTSPSLQSLHKGFSCPKYSHLHGSSRFRPRLRYSSIGLRSIAIRASSTVTLEPVLPFSIPTLSNYPQISIIIYILLIIWNKISNFAFEGVNNSAKSKYRALCVPSML